MRDGLLAHLRGCGISSNQHGFFTRKSTTTQLLECCYDWNLGLKSHKEVDIVHLDFAKAFDTVVHSKLIAKLECYNVNAALITWIKCFLSNRLQFVKIGNSCSSTCSVISGVPQGSVLGPVLLLFILMTFLIVCFVALK